MAACNLGCTSNIKLFGAQLDIEKTRYTGLVKPYKSTFSRLRSPCGSTRLQTRLEPVQAIGFDCQHHRFPRSSVVSCGSSSAIGETELGDNSEEEKSNQNQIILGSPEVQSLLETICDTTSIAEFELKLAGFRLHVKRNLEEKNVLPPASIPPPVQDNVSSHTPESNGSATSTSLVVSKSKTSSGGVQKFLDTAKDEGLVILQSPKVGFFRRSRTIKGKRAPPPCKEKQAVKEGQVLCYIEQLGGEIPIESDVSGEVVKILREDGEPVGYGDALVSILPSFPGIKKLQ